MQARKHPCSFRIGEAVDTVEVLLRDAVKARTLSDVPLGAFLSGGIDSSVVVALLQAESGSRVRTFTIGFENSPYDESPHAAAVARHLGTDHTEMCVTPEQALEVIPRLPRLYDEPFADASQIPTFLVSQLARGSVSVALSGDGGDEVFGGYNRYVIGTRIWHRLSRVPLFVRRATAGFARSVPPAWWDALGAGVDRLLPPQGRRVLSGTNVHKVAGILDVGSLDDMYCRLVSMWKDPNAVVRGGREPAFPWLAVEPQLSDPAHWMMLRDLLGYLPDDILVKVDRASMGVSLEARAPLLDHRVVELAWKLPLAQKIRGREGKWLLRRVLERHVPNTLFDRTKQGFGIPIDTWLRGPLRAWAEDLLAPDRLRREGYLEPEPIQRALREHLQGKRNRQYELWAILMFQSWLAEQGGNGSFS